MLRRAQPSTLARAPALAAVTAAESPEGALLSGGVVVTATA